MESKMFFEALFSQFKEIKHHQMLSVNSFRGLFAKARLQNWIFRIYFLFAER